MNFHAFLKFLYSPLAIFSKLAFFPVLLNKKRNDSLNRVSNFYLRCPHLPRHFENEMHFLTKWWHFENENLSWQLDNEFSLSKCHHFVNSSEAFRGMKMASNRKNRTTFTFTTFWAYGVKVVLFFRFEAVFMLKTGTRKN